MVKKFSLLLLTLSLMLVMAACGSKEEPKQETAPTTDNTETQATEPSNGGDISGSLKMIGWTNKAVNDYITAFNKKFEEKYPNVKVDYVVSQSDDVYKQLMQSRLTANDVDIFPNLSGFILSPQTWSPGAEKPNWQQWIESGLIADLSNEAFVKNYNENDVKNAGKFDGKVYGIPTGTVSFSGLYYNKEIFEKNGLKVPTTWGEFENVLKTLKTNGVIPIAFAGKDTWPLAISVQGLQASIYDNQLEFIQGLWEGKTKFTDPKAMEVLDKAKVMMDYSIEGFMGIDYATLPALFTSGQVAMIGDGSWHAPEFAQANPDLKFGYFPVPGSDNAANNQDLAGKYDMTWLVAQKGPNKAAALKWLEMFSEPDNYKGFVDAAGFLPVQPNIQVKSEFIQELAPYLKNFKLGWEQLMINKPNLGEHLANAGVHAEFIAPGGPFKTTKELAEVQQKEWDAAK